MLLVLVFVFFSGGIHVLLLIWYFAVKRALFILGAFFAVAPVGGRDVIVATVAVDLCDRVLVGTDCVGVAIDIEVEVVEFLVLV